MLINEETNDNPSSINLSQKEISNDVMLVIDAMGDKLISFKLMSLRFQFIANYKAHFWVLRSCPFIYFVS